MTSKSFDIEVLYKCKTAMVNRIHEFYQEKRGKTILSQEGSTLGIGDTPIGEAVKVMLWDTTEERGIYRITLCRYTRIT